MRLERSGTRFIWKLWSKAANTKAQIVSIKESAPEARSNRATIPLMFFRCSTSQRILRALHRQFLLILIAALPVAADSELQDMRSWQLFDPPEPTSEMWRSGTPPPNSRWRFHERDGTILAERETDPTYGNPDFKNRAWVLATKSGDYLKGQCDENHSDGGLFWSVGYETAWHSISSDCVIELKDDSDQYFALSSLTTGGAKSYRLIGITRSPNARWRVRVLATFPDAPLTFAITPPDRFFVVFLKRIVGVVHDTQRVLFTAKDGLQLKASSAEISQAGRRLYLDMFPSVGTLEIPTGRFQFVRPNRWKKPILIFRDPPPAGLIRDGGGRWNRDSWPDDFLF